MMIRPVLMASLFALAAPAFAQTTTTHDDMATMPTTAVDQMNQTPTGTMNTSVQGDVRTDADTDLMNQDSTNDLSVPTGTSARTGKPDAMATPSQATTAVDPMAQSATSATAMPSTTGNAMGAGTTVSAGGMGGPADIQSQWGSYDDDGNGTLTPLEFGKWMMEANGQGGMNARVEATRRSRQSNLPAIQVLNTTAGALARADTDHDWMVSRDELLAYAPQ